jgi:hypothetical protein
MEILAKVEQKKAEAQGVVERANLEAQRLEREARAHQLEAEELKRVRIFLFGDYDTCKARFQYLRNSILKTFFCSCAPP